MAELRTPQGHTLLLPEGKVSVGSDPANDVPVAAHLGLAPFHFRLQPWEGGHFLEDAGSGLGTLVNGHPVNWKPLAPGDTILAGELEVTYAQKVKCSTFPVPSVIAPEPFHTTALGLPAPPLPLPLPMLQGPFSPLPAVVQPPPPSLPPPLPSPLCKPPAWLPEDLLPENSARLLLNDAAGAPAEPPAPPFSPPIPLASPPPRSGHRWLRIAALLALCFVAGHLVWKAGYLDVILEKIRTTVGVPTQSESPPKVIETPGPENPPTPIDTVAIGDSTQR